MFFLPVYRSPPLWINKHLNKNELGKYPVILINNPSMIMTKILLNGTKHSLGKPCILEIQHALLHLLGMHRIHKKLSRECEETIL